MSNISVLVCEDIDDMREAISTALSDAGMEVFVAANGEQAVDQALTHQPDVILMDVMMPEMTGHEAVAKIRQNEWGRDVKVIFLTSLSDAKNVAEAVAAGSDEYLVKPHTSLEDIVNKVRLISHT